MILVNNHSKSCCQTTECQRGTLIRDYSYAGLLPEVKQRICDLAMNGSDIRDNCSPDRESVGVCVSDFDARCGNRIAHQSV